MLTHRQTLMLQAQILKVVTASIILIHSKDATLMVQHKTVIATAMDADDVDAAVSGKCLAALSFHYFFNL